MDRVEQRSTVIFGFDSAWTNAPKSPGAICAVAFDEQGGVRFHAPRLASFEKAREFIDGLRKDFAVSLVAIDQPTVVPNATGSRPVDRVAASVISHIGGGVQPANRKKHRMFGDGAPIWPFISELGATEDPIQARTATSGHFLIEVFPALALPGFEENFAGRHCAPKYNPRNRKKFRLEDWRSVCRVVEKIANEFGVRDLAAWARDMHDIATPRKCNQDKLDAALCTLIGLTWRADCPARSVMLGDLDTGYMITPTSEATRSTLERAANQRCVSIV